MLATGAHGAGRRLSAVAVATSTSSSSSRIGNQAVWTHVRHSHIGRAPLFIPPSIKLNILPFPPVGHPLRRQPKALRDAQLICVEGPRGQVVVPLHECVELQWGEVTEKKGKTTAAAATAADAGQETEAAKLSVIVRDTAEKRQRQLWGMTRAMLANAVEGVQEGHSVVLRLVGVGYRAVVEDDPFPRPDKFERAFRNIAEATVLAADSSAALGFFSSPAQRDYYASLLDAQGLASKQAEQALDRPVGALPVSPARSLIPAKRLSLRLGYSHPIYITVPRGITCTTPQPTRILLQSADKEAMGLFAAQIRKWRKPEPYKGKGVFVGDETIRIKAVKKK